MNADYAKLAERERERGILGSLLELAEWDESTYMPKKGGDLRGEQKAYLAKRQHALLSDPKTGELLSALEQSDWLKSAPVEKANVRALRRVYEQAVRVPGSLVEEIARLSTASVEAWTEARRTSEFKGFQPYLEKMIGLRQQVAKSLGYDKNPYDALLDLYEPGAKTEEVRSLFAILQKEISQLLGTVDRSSKKPRLDVLARDYTLPEQKKLSDLALKALGFDLEAGRLDLTTHPFCRGASPTDVRLTTRYELNDLRDGLFSTIHEAGHGMYEQGLPFAHWPMPASKACSMGIHESQSRLWENMVARGEAFWEFFYPTLKELYPALLKDVSLSDFVFAVNAVDRGFIRTDSDEVTYNLHIILRFELEEKMLTGDLKAADVPEAWNAKFKELFGVVPPKAALGCLQDIHWSCGDIGYFPTYTLGNLYAAQWMETARAALGNLDEDFKSGNFSRLKGWLAKNIYSEGQTLFPNELCLKVSGKPLSPEPLLRHLRKKIEKFY